MKNTKRPAAFLPNGEIDRRGMKGTAYTVMAPLVAGVVAAVPPPAPAALWLRHTVTALYNMGHAADFADALQLLYALAGLATPPDMEPYIGHPTAAAHFMLSCLAVVEDMTEGAACAMD
jgi:hypothetical protein